MHHGLRFATLPAGEVLALPGRCQLSAGLWKYRLD